MYKPVDTDHNGNHNDNDNDNDNEQLQPNADKNDEYNQLKTLTNKDDEQNTFKINDYNNNNNNNNDDEDIVINSKGEKIKIIHWKQSETDKSFEMLVWRKVLPEFDYDYKEAMERLMADRGSMAVESALVMTIGFGGLFLGSVNYITDNGYEIVIPFFFSIAGFSSLAAVLAASLEWSKLNSMNPNKFIVAIELIGKCKMKAFDYLLLSIISLMIASILLTFTIYGNWAGLVVACTSLFFLYSVYRHIVIVWELGDPLKGQDVRLPKSIQQ